MKHQFSISLRLTLWFGAIFFMGWILFGTGMWLSLQHTLKNERHQTLSRRIDRLQDLLIKDQDAADTDRAQDFADFAHATGNGLAEVFLADGERAFPSPSEAASNFPWPKVQRKDEASLQTIRAASQLYLVMVRPFKLGDQHLVLMAAAPEAGSILILQSFRDGLLWSIPILLLISSVSGYWVSRRALSPVDRITAIARSISIRNISERIPVHETGDELQRLADTCNAMLDRLESSVTQIKRFTADASHELRGPLSYIRTVAELAMHHPLADMESRVALTDIVEEVSKASILLEEMLTLARADSVPVSLPRTPVDLTQLLDEACDMGEPLAGRQGIALARHYDCSEIVVLGDAAALKRLIWILLDNALKYSNPNGTIDVSLSAYSDQAEIVVRDNGIGISTEDLPLIFDRFYRADPSRSTVEGNGLGLAIAKWIAETHHAHLAVSSAIGNGTAFTLTIPRTHMLRGSKTEEGTSGANLERQDNVVLADLR